MDGDCISTKGRNQTAFLKTIISSDIGNIFYWKFKFDLHIENGVIGTAIGIWKTNIGDIIKLKNSCFCWWGNNCYTFISAKAKLTNGDYGVSDKSYGIKCKTNDIVEMIVDMKKLEIKFKVNNIDYGKAYDIEDTTYRAAVYLNDVGNKIRLL